MSEDILEKQLFEIIKDEDMDERIKCAKVDMLIRLGVDVNVMYGARSPLRLARDNNLKKIVELLENNGAKDVFDEKIANEFGVKLIKACQGEEKKDVKEIKELIDMGADVHAENDYGYTALIMALNYGHKEIAEILIKNGANVNAKTSDGWTALMNASHEGDKEIVELLIQNGADINAENNDGWTALMSASTRNHKEIVKLLIQNGVNINARDYYGETALINTSERGYGEIVELLIQHGADIDIENNKGETALMLASNSKTEKIIKRAVSKKSKKVLLDKIKKGFGIDK